MSQDHVARFAELVGKGFEAVGCRIPVSQAEGAVVARDVFVEFGHGISFYKASAPETPFMSFPVGADYSAAAALCIHVLSGIVARAVESDRTDP